MARISINKLAELLVSSSATRRRRIVFDQKHPPDVIVARYRLALPVVHEFFTAEVRDTRVIDRAILRLRSDNSGGVWAMEDRQGTADALEHLIMVAPMLPADVACAAGTNDPEKISVEGVSISVRPDLILTSVRRGKRYSGAIKFHWVKNDESALQRKGAEFVAVVMHEWLRQFGPANHTPDPKHCLSVDVFRHAVVSSPKAITRRWDEIVAGCQEVSARWTQL